MPRLSTVLLLALSAALCGPTPTSVGVQSPTNGATKAGAAAEIREVDLDGLKKLLQRQPQNARPLLVNFWATWCDPCREEFPDLVKIDARYRPKGLDFLAVSLDDIKDIKTTVPEFLAEMKATMPVVLLNVVDPEPTIHTVDPQWDGQLPATFLFDREGHVVFKHFGPVQPDELAAAIEKTVNAKR